MKRLLPLTLAWIIPAASFAEAVEDAEVMAIDGNVLRGHVTGLDPGRLTLESPNFFAPAPLELSQILQVSMPPREGDLDSDHIATITLTNGDVLRGQLVSFDEKAIGLRTWYAGDLSFRRSMVDKLDIQDSPGRIYSGPSGEDDWAQTDPKRWQVDGNQLVCRGMGGISRMLKLPSKVRFSFDLAWRQSPRFHFYFFADRIGGSKLQNFFDLSCQNRYVYLRKTKDERNGTILGNTDVREFSQARQAHIDIYANRESGLIRLMVNNRFIVDWNDADAAGAAMGGGIHFVNDDSSAMKVSRIEVTEWDGNTDLSAEAAADPGEDEGEAPQASQEAAPPANPTRIRLKNNDEIDGETVGISDGMVKLKTTFGEVEIPVSRLRTFSLHSADERKNPELYEIPRLYADDIRGWFADGSRVTLRLKDVQNGKIDAYSQPFGDASFDLSAFQRIEFNLYREGLDELRNQEHW